MAEQNQTQYLDDMGFDSIKKAMEEAGSSLKTAEYKEAIDQIAQSGESVTLFENTMRNSLVLNKLLSDQKYREELEEFYAEVARKSGVKFEGENTAETFEKAQNLMFSLTEEDLSRVSKTAYGDLLNEGENPHEVKDRLRLMGIQGTPDQMHSLANKAILADLYNQKFNNGKNDVYVEVGKNVKAINQGLLKATDKKAGLKLASMLVSGAATGGTSWVLKGASFGVKKLVSNKKVQNLANKASKGFRGFLESRNVDLSGYDKAKENLKQQTEGFMKSRWGKRIAVAAGAGALVAWAVAAGDYDFDSIKTAVVELNDELIAGADASGMIPDDGFVQGAAPDAAPVQPEASGESSSPDDEIAEPIKETPSIEIESGGSIYSSVEAALVEKFGEENVNSAMVTQATNDVLAQNPGIDPRTVQAGQSFAFDPSLYEGIDSVSQHTVDSVQNASGANLQDTAPNVTETPEKPGFFKGIGEKLSGLIGGSGVESSAPVGTDGNPDAVKVEPDEPKFKPGPNAPFGQ